MSLPIGASWADDEDEDVRVTGGALLPDGTQCSHAQY